MRTAYDARSLRQLAAFVTSPNADDSGIWQGDTGPAADTAGNVFVATGNGAFDVTRGGHDYGDSILRLTRTGNTIPTVADGHVYVGAKGELDVYGLLRAPSRSAAT